MYKPHLSAQSGKTAENQATAFLMNAGFIY
jgi:hypothetical protein